MDIVLKYSSTDELPLVHSSPELTQTVMLHKVNLKNFSSVRACISEHVQSNLLLNDTILFVAIAN